MAGIADLKEAFPAYYQENFMVVSGTDWEIGASAVDSAGAPISWTGCTAIAKFRRDRNSTVVKTATQTLTGGMQIDLSTAGRIILKATPACVWADDVMNRPLTFNLQVTSTSPALVLVPFQRCSLIPQPNLND